MGIDKIIIIFLLLMICFLQLRFLLLEKNTTALYLCKKLLLNKDYYLKIDSIDNQIVSILVNSLNDKQYRVNGITEKGLKIYFFCDNNNLTFNTLTKKMKEQT